MATSGEVSGFAIHKLEQIIRVHYWKIPVYISQVASNDFVAEAPMRNVKRAFSSSVFDVCVFEVCGTRPKIRRKVLSRRICFWWIHWSHGLFDQVHPQEIFQRGYGKRY